MDGTEWTKESQRIPYEIGLLRVGQRIRAGRVVLHGLNIFTDSGGPVPEALVGPLREFFDHGHARLEPEDDSGARRAILTAAGQTLLAELEEGDGRDEERVAIHFGHEDPRLTLEFSDADSLERLSAVAADGARRLRARTAPADRAAEGGAQ